MKEENSSKEEAKQKADDSNRREEKNNGNRESSTDFGPADKDNADSINIQSEEQKVDGPKSGKEPDCDSVSDLDSLFSLADEELPGGLGEIIGSVLSERAEQVDDQGMMVALKASKSAQELDKSELDKAMRASIALRARLLCLLQSSVQKHSYPGRYGRLDTQSLYHLHTGTPKVFRKAAAQKGLNTAVHILLDSSGSMNGAPIQLAVSASYAIAKALETQRGISAGITAFPAYHPQGIGVYQLLPQGQRLSSRMKIQASGDTPLGAALYWVMQELYKRKEERKILFILTDGYPTDRPLAIKALQDIGKIGVESYGLGLISGSISELQPEKSRVIYDLQELAPAMFDLLGNILKHGKER